MRDVSVTLSLKASFIDKATEALYQSLLPGYTEVYEQDGGVELVGKRHRVYVGANDVLSAVLMEELRERHQEQETRQEARMGRRLVKAYNELKAIKNGFDEAQPMYGLYFRSWWPGWTKRLADLKPEEYLAAS